MEVCAIVVERAKTMVEVWQLKNVSRTVVQEINNTCSSPMVLCNLSRKMLQLEAR